MHGQKNINLLSCSRNSPHITVAERFLPLSQQPAALFYPEAHLSSLRHSAAFHLR